MLEIFSLELPGHIILGPVSHRVWLQVIEISEYQRLKEDRFIFLLHERRNVRADMMASR